jgi:hypothetical protein
MRKLLYSMIVLLLTEILAAASQGISVGNTAKPSDIKPYNCEANIAVLSAAHQDAASDGLIITIARLGGRESKRDLNRRRLHNLRVFLTKFAWARDPKTIVTAEGESVEGYGRIELYIKGKLYDVLAIRRNGDLLVGSCELDDIRPKKAENDLYPYRDSKKPKRP